MDPKRRALLAAGAAAVAIAAAPTAAAANQQTCSGNVCQSPGNVLFTAAVRSSARHRGGDGPTFGERMAGRRRCC